MNTLFLLMAQYQGAAVIPLDRLSADYFSHLTPTKLRSKIITGVIDLPLVRIENSQKAAQGVHLADLARYLDQQREQAVRENDKLHNRAG